MSRAGFDPPSRSYWNYWIPVFDRMAGNPPQIVQALPKPNNPNKLYSLKNPQNRLTFDFTLDNFAAYLCGQM
jgi:hypothetical protein